MNNVWRFDAIGTKWSIETIEKLGEGTRRRIAEQIEEFDRAYSRFRDDSIVAEMTERAGKFKLPDSSKELGELYRRLYELTDGAVTPLIGGGLAAAGYDKAYSLSPTTPPLPAPAWDEVLRWDEEYVTTTCPVVLDIGAAGKGKLVDIIGNSLEMAGISTYVIDASGDVRHRGSETQTIGLESPFDQGRVIGTMPLRDASLCASATNRRRWGDGWHHVLDGRSGEPTRDVVATWALAQSTMVADGLATALFFVGADRLQKFGEFQFVRLFSNGKVEYSRDFVGQLFL